VQAPGSSSYRGQYPRPITGTHWAERDGLDASTSPGSIKPSGLPPAAPAALALHNSLPAGHWHGERAAIDILVLARKGKAFAALDKLLIRQGGPQVLAGSTLALSAAIDTWAKRSDTTQHDLINSVLQQDPAFPQCLLRALIYRAVTEHLARPHLRRPDAADPYLPAVQIATRLARQC